MSARTRNQQVENPTRENGSEKPLIVHDRQKPRSYRKKSKALDLYHAGIGTFLQLRKERRVLQAENAKVKQERVRNVLLG